MSTPAAIPVVAISAVHGQGVCGGLARIRHERVHERARRTAPSTASAMPHRQHGDEGWLSPLLRGGPVVLIFYRGEWCPYCNLRLRTFQANRAQLAEHRAQLVAISP
jgi:thiol-disulfide isomerase/thioredoxin